MKNKLCTVLHGVSFLFAVLTFSIGLPIYFRPFYYWQITPLNLPFLTGKDPAVIKDAFDRVMNYLTLPFTPFDTGEFRHSPEGAAHFADCKVLFFLNGAVLFLSVLTLSLLWILHKRNKITLLRPWGFSAPFYAASTLFFGFLGITVAVAVDFDTAFTVFHQLLFPGKDNWIFNPRTDEIIKILPETFFIRCGILIAGVLLCISVTVMLVAIFQKYKQQKKKPDVH